MFVNYCSDSSQFLLLQKLDIRLGHSKEVSEGKRQSESPLTSNSAELGLERVRQSVGIAYGQSCQVSLPTLEDSKNKTNKQQQSLKG